MTWLAVPGALARPGSFLPSLLGWFSTVSRTSCTLRLGWRHSLIRRNGAAVNRFTIRRVHFSSKQRVPGDAAQILRLKSVFVASRSKTARGGSAARISAPIDLKRLARRSPRRRPGIARPALRCPAASGFSLLDKPVAAAPYRLPAAYRWR